MTETYYKLGDAIRGDRITATARKITRQILIENTSRHRANQVILKGSAFCVIDLPLKSIRDKK